MALIDRLEEKVSRGGTARGKLLDTLLAALADSPDAAATASAWAQLAPHFDLLLQTPADVDRLQQTLLTLAVKGRLVPQDPNDEPAAELLRRIRAEKERLVAAGKIKRDKPLPAIANDEVPYPLPTSWCWVRLPEICHDWGQKVPDGPFTYIDVGAIDNVRGVITDATQLLDASNAPSRARKIVRPGTVLYSTVRPYLLNIAIVDRLFEPEPIASTAFAVLHPFAGIDGRFLFHYLRSQPFVNFVASKMVGVAYPAINDGNFFSGLFPLPPVAEQSRIVATVASLTALCDRLRERLAARRELSAKLTAALTEGALS
jgi:type I restriction enzyme S subunit